MIIGIDGNEANGSHRVGIGEYAYELLQAFSRNPLHNTSFRIYLKQPKVTDLPEENDSLTYRVIGPSKLWTQIALPIDLYRYRPRPDVFFTPTHYAPRFSPISVVISIMDLSYFHFPAMFNKADLYQLRHWTAYSVKKARKILTISQASKNDIIKLYNIDESRIVVTYPGIRMNNKTADSSNDRNVLKNTYGISKNYILFVGTLQPRKNIVQLIKAFAAVKQGKEPTELVIVGKKGWLFEEILQAPKKFAIADKVKFLQFVPDQDLQILYKNALCFVLPSLYEGFGLPILEAMSNGCPVITSNVSSLPEAGGDAALYVDPQSVSSITEKLELMLQNEKLRHELREKGYKQIKKFSWEKTAKETLAVLEQVGLEK